MCFSSLHLSMAAVFPPHQSPSRAGPRDCEAPPPAGFTAACCREHRADVDQHLPCVPYTRCSESSDSCTRIIGSFNRSVSSSTAAFTGSYNPTAAEPRCHPVWWPRRGAPPAAASAPAAAAPGSHRISPTTPWSPRGRYTSCKFTEHAP